MNIKSLIYIILLTIGMTSCRMNGGDIGMLYGEWALRSYTVDGVAPDDIDVSKYYWAFQGTVVNIIETLPYNEVDGSFGTFEQVDKTLILNFTHTNASEGGSSIFDPPAELGIPGREITEMNIIVLTAKNLQLSFTDSIGQEKVYKLEKLL